MLSGAAAGRRPDIDRLTAVPLGIVTHVVRETDDRGNWRRVSGGPGLNLGRLDPTVGAYRTTVGRMTPAERREAGLRRNGRPRRQKTAG